MNRRELLKDAPLVVAGGAVAGVAAYVIQKAHKAPAESSEPVVVIHKLLELPLDGDEIAAMTAFRDSAYIATKRGLVYRLEHE